MKQIVSTENAPQAIGPYSQAVSAGGFVFVSGQIPLIPESGEMEQGDIESQTERVLRNLKAILEAAGASLESVVKTTVYLAEIKDFSRVNEVYARYFDKNAPARVCVAVKDLPKGALVEIDAIAEIEK